MVLFHLIRPAQQFAAVISVAVESAQWNSLKPARGSNTNKVEGAKQEYMQETICPIDQEIHKTQFDLSRFCTFYLTAQ